MLKLLLLLAACASADVVNIAADGSFLQISEPWRACGWNYTDRIGFSHLHSFCRDPLKADVAIDTRRRATAEKRIKTMVEVYYEHLRIPPGALKPESKALANGTNLHYIMLGLPSIEGDRRAHYLLEGYFDRGTRNYYYIVTAPTESVRSDDFEKQALESFRILGTLSWAGGKSPGEGTYDAARSTAPAGKRAAPPDDDGYVDLSGDTRPPRVRVPYTTKDGKRLAAPSAYAGWITLFTDYRIMARVDEAVRRHGGKIVQSFADAGLYTVAVEPGQEDAFLKAMYKYDFVREGIPTSPPAPAR